MHYNCRVVLCFASLGLLLSVTATPVKQSKPSGSYLKHNPAFNNKIDEDSVFHHDTEIEDYGTKITKKATTTTAPDHKSDQYYEYSWGTPMEEGLNGDAIAQVTFKHTPSLYYYGVAEAGPRHLKVVYFNRQHNKQKKQQRKQSSKRYRY